MSIEGSGTWAKEFNSRLAIVDAECERIPHAFSGVVIPREVRLFIASRVHSSQQALERAVIQVAGVVALDGAVTIDDTRRILGDFLHSERTAVTVEKIKATVSAFYKLHVKYLDSASRVRTLVRPRQIAMYFCKKMTRRSYPEIGRRFGGRDHTTVMHAVRQIERMRLVDGVIANDVAELETILRLAEQPAQPEAVG